MRSTSTLTLLCAVAFGCATPVDPTPRDPRLELPDAFAAGADSSDVEDYWWRSFGDPELERLITRAFRHNRDVGAAAARLAAALAEANLAGADIGPSLDATFGATRSRQVFVGFPIPGASQPLSTTTSNFGLGLNLSWELD
ncbi:MAG: TolC family protein, partial [Planctomycetes bacterium]|nr:TolC family protein [Planctomycetota bacterium]